MLGALARLLQLDVGRRLVSAGLDFKQQTPSGQAYDANHRAGAGQAGFAALVTLGLRPDRALSLARARLRAIVALGVIGPPHRRERVRPVVDRVLRGGPAQRSSSAAPGAEPRRFCRACRRHRPGPPG